MITSILTFCTALGLCVMAMVTVCAEREDV